MNLKPNKILNGKFYDCRKDPTLNSFQKDHLLGKIDVNESIKQDNQEDLPSLAMQWKMDYRRRFCK